MLRDNLIITHIPKTQKISFFKSNFTQKYPIVLKH